MSNIDKIAKINLENKPYVKPVSNVDIGFYNLDNGTAKLQFVITRDGFPMQMGPVNVTGYLWLKSTNGTMSGQLDLEIIDGLNGVVGVTIPNWFLVGATDTDVKGQIILAVNENTDIATLGEFGFHVKDALPNQIKGEIKVQYFRMFDDMKQVLEDKVADIESRLGDLDILGANVETTVTNGITQINQTVSERKSDLTEVINQYNTEVYTIKSVAIDEVNTAKSNAISTVNSKADESVSNVESVSNNAVTHVDEKLNEFNQAILDNEFVKPEGLNDKLSSLTWQKYKLTQDDGKPTFYTEIDPLTLPPGQYQISYMKNNPFNNNGSALYNVEILQGIDNTKQIFAVVSYSGQVFIKNVHKGTDLGWKELTKTQTDTGWITYQLINGALSNTAYKNTGENGFDCAYRTITNGSIVTKKLRINGSNIVPGQVIAQLPTNFAKNTQSFPVKTPYVTNNAQVVIKPNGEVGFHVSNSDNTWDETGYAYAELTWHD
ncbi:BppU family phage baseplate upper protein [Mammaliicoccus sp. P-M59]|uniref:BppU family phage baseplate upper protein n=1 Tax=Mammaliicoccus sp. P-M59 TaxID=2898718 RepID=UPI001EFB9BDC|nr:BppU family phage baseplate upper protein [Mammaliicoccus sp. P-M59]